MKLFGFGLVLMMIMINCYGGYESGSLYGRSHPTAHGGYVFAWHVILLKPGCGTNIDYFLKKVKAENRCFWQKVGPEKKGFGQKAGPENKPFTQKVGPELQDDDWFCPARYSPVV